MSLLWVFSIDCLRCQVVELYFVFLSLYVASDSIYCMMSHNVSSCWTKTRVCLSKQLPLIILSMKTKSTRVWSLFKETAALEYLEYEETLQWDFMNYSVLREKIQQQGRKLKNFLCIWCKFTTTWACYQNRMIVMIHRINL